MFRKGLITLVCLTVMSALWSWAAATYSITTKITSLGTYKAADGTYKPIVGGSIQVRDKALQTSGLKYANFTTSQPVPLTVDAAEGYKIASLTLNGVAVPGAANQTGPFNFNVNRPSPVATQAVIATFAVDSGDETVVSKTWQLQVQNNNGGGVIKVARPAGTLTPATYSTIGKPWVKNYVDTTSVKVTVDADPLYFIDYIIVNGKKTFYTQADDTVDAVTINPNNGRIWSVLAGYKKRPIKVTTQTATYVDPKTGEVKFVDNGILPVNPNVDPYGAVRLVITPTGADNVVKTVVAKAGAVELPVTLTDRFGDPVTLPHTGAVKAAISGITSNITVTATYGFDAAKSGQYSGCTQTCHQDSGLDASVKAADTQWLLSGHRAKNVDCVACHTTMPGPITKSSVDPATFTVTDASAGAEGSNYCSKCHAASVARVLASAHYTKPSGAMACTDCHAQGHNPAGNRAACATCHTYVNEHTAENTAGKGCVECHDKHNPATITGTLGTPTAHPAVTLYTFEEIGMQMAGGARVPVQVDANGKGMPYSPKQTCGTSGCHVKGGVDYTYDKISDHAFHSNEGRSEYQDSATGKFDATKNKPWVQSAAMVGKW